MSAPISLGICVSPEQAARVAPGYDYLELALASALMPLEDDAIYAPQRQRLHALQPPVRSFSIFVASQVKLVGPSVDWEQVETYVARAVARAADLGGRIIGFGSGGARSVPDGFSRALAWGQLVRFANLCADYAAPHGLAIALEPLNTRECNILNTYLEAAQLARDVDRLEIGVVADIYHFVMDAEPLEDILKAPEHLIHVHLADTGRLYPGSGTYPLEHWFEILREVNYRGGASIECRWGDDFEGESARALAFLKTLTA
jgi:sugar phosphate isomerase/epimerase